MAVLTIGYPPLTASAGVALPAISWPRAVSKTCSSSCESSCRPKIMLWDSSTRRRTMSIGTTGALRVMER